MNGIRLRELKIDAVKNILLVAFVVNGSDFRGIKKTPAVQASQGDEVTPLVTAVCQIEACIGCAKTSIGRSEIAMRNLFAQAGASSNVDYHACLLAKFRRRRAGDDFK